jgi:hypothetical protein
MGGPEMAPCTLDVRHGFLGGSTERARCVKAPVWECALPRLSWGTSSGELRLERQYRGDAHHGEAGDESTAKEA